MPDRCPQRLKQIKAPGVPAFHRLNDSSGTCAGSIQTSDTNKIKIILPIISNCARVCLNQIKPVKCEHTLEVRCRTRLLQVKQKAVVFIRYRALQKYFLKPFQVLLHYSNRSDCS
ncbi:hypothetical protein GOODEAATRI_017182 [Goodea atripinnis]|uniref:Uncharacterized protein n=1 Tax=Goodea atripinnis TaxID=208336 RepID=A0ABV0NB97_9TELE